MPADAPRRAHELPAAARDTLTRAAMATRPTPYGEDPKARAAQVRVYVRGRYTERGLRWDVLRIANGRAELHTAGLLWQDEAIEMAFAVLTNRVMFAPRGSGSGMTFAPFGKSALVLPDRRMLPRAGVKLKPQDGRPVDRSLNLEVTR